MPVYKGRTAGTWRVIVPTERGPVERIVRGTKRAARDYHAQLRLENPRRAEARAGLTVEQWCLGPYLETMSRRVRVSTWRCRRTSMRAMCAHLRGLRLAELSLPALERAVAARSAEVAQGTVRRDSKALWHALRLASAMGHLVGCVSAVSPARPASRARAYTDQELARLFTSADAIDPELGRLLRFLLVTGLRRGEAIAARWSWVDGDTLHIPDLDRVTGWRPKRGPRDVPLSAEALALLVRGRGEKLWRWLGWPDELSARAWRDAGLDGSPHRLRHTFASRFLAVVPDLWLLGRVLGHSATTTTELYLHLVPGRLDAARGVVTLKTVARTMAAQS